jgi:hypothetical protein
VVFLDLLLPSDGQARLLALRIGAGLSRIEKLPCLGAAGRSLVLKGATIRPRLEWKLPILMDTGRAAAVDFSR